MKKRAFFIYFVSAFEHILDLIKVWYIILYCFLTSKRLRDATIVVQTRVFSFVIKKR